MAGTDSQPAGHLPREAVLPLLQALPDWGPVTTIVFAYGCVFEFKGAFPDGEKAGGYYNLRGPLPGFHGHLRLDTLAAVRFQQRPHRGRESMALVFTTRAGESVFKVFLGRDANGDIVSTQRERFERLRASSQADATTDQSTLEDTRS